MFLGKKVLAVVPARGGSKGVKHKNIRQLSGIPLVGITARVISNISLIDRAVISTDSENVLSVAQAYGLSAPFLRPKSISGDMTGDWEVLNHALLEMEAHDKTRYDVVLMLQPTSPARKAEDVIATMDKLISGNFDAVWTVSPTDSKYHPLKQLTLSSGGTLEFYDPRGVEITARQQLKTLYHRNGIAYAFTRSCILDSKNIRGKKTGFLLIEQTVPNIDTEHDFLWAEFYFERKRPE